MNDKNELLDKFSAPLGNSENKFIEYAAAHNIIDHMVLIEEFKSVQNQTYDYVYTITEPNLQLSAGQIEKISYNFCKRHFNWINDKGIAAVNRWLIWMCWHEGILKKEG
jgi:hypothetical protein